MARCEETDITVVSAKGQVVIPKEIRTKLGIGPKTKLLVYGCKDTVIMKKLTAPDLRKEFDTIHKEIDSIIAKFGELTDEEINEIIQDHRKKRASTKAK